MHAMPPTREMERAYQASDASYDGVFFLGVRSTRVFCRPSCPARKPLPRNVVYFATTQEALAARFRPCKRCRPLDVTGRRPAWAAKLIGELGRSPSSRVADAELRNRGIDPARARRYFLKHYGMTFQKYSRAQRMNHALHQLRNGADLDEVALGTGYDSHSGFRAAFVRTFGHPPGRGRMTDCVLTTCLEGPLGPMLAGATERGICLLEFAEPGRMAAQCAALRKQFGRVIVPGENDLLGELKSELDRYFAGQLQAFSLALEYPGTAFQRQVWEALLAIPYGETRSYAEIAGTIGSPKSVRAVGRANGCNRIAILIPCHRVVNANGELGGYGGGLWRKKWLLNLERRGPGAN